MASFAFPTAEYLRTQEIREFMIDHRAHYDEAKGGPWCVEIVVDPVQGDMAACLCTCGVLWIAKTVNDTGQVLRDRKAIFQHKGWPYREPRMTR